MNADIIHNHVYPHGTPDGYRGGCRGSHCPAPVPCRDVYLRYQGDYGFRRAIDSGVTVQDFLADERKKAQEAAHAALLAKQATVRAAHRERANQARRDARRASGISPAPVRSPGNPTTPLQVDVHRLHQEGLTDREIAERIGKTRTQVKAIRSYLGLAPHHKPTAVPRVLEFIRDGLTDKAIADLLGLNPRYVASIRRNEASTTVGASSIQGYGGGA